MFVDDTADLASPSIFLPQSSCNLATRMRICILRHYLLLHIVHVCSLTWSLSFRLCWRFYQGDPDIQSRHESLLLNWCLCSYSWSIWCGALISTWVAVNLDIFLWATVQHPTHDRIDRRQKPHHSNSETESDAISMHHLHEQALSDFSKSV